MKKVRNKMRSIISVFLVTKIVFLNPLYIIISSLAGFAFWILTNTFDKLLFFSPALAFYVPKDMLAGFLLTCINSVLVGILVSFNLHLLRNLRLRISKSALSGTTISVISSTCASCSTLAFTLTSTFGAIGIAASDFL